MFLIYVVLIKFQQMSHAVTHNILISKFSTCKIYVDVGVDDDDDDDDDDGGDYNAVATPLQRSEIMHFKH
jgi:hypothetical protein